MAEVILNGVCKRYGQGDWAVDHVDLEVADQELLVLVGPSGCGKSSTLRMIAGLETLSEGKIEIGGRVVNDMAPKDRDIAMVFQNYALYPHMSVYRNMAFGLQLRYGGGWLARGVRKMFKPALAAELEVKRKEIPGRVEAAARMLGIEHLLQRMPGQCPVENGNEWQWVGRLCGNLPLFCLMNLCQILMPDCGLRCDAN